MNTNITININVIAMKALMKPMALATNNDGEPSVSDD
jgi:hypothetical protein